VRERFAAIAVFNILINLMQEYFATFREGSRLISGLENGVLERIWVHLGRIWVANLDTLWSA
jgi:hypothetical protein